MTRSYAVKFLTTNNLSVADCQCHEGVTTDETLSCFMTVNDAMRSVGPGLVPG